MRRLFILLSSLLVTLSLLVNTASAQPFKGRPSLLQEVQAPAVQKIVTEKLNEVKPGTPFLGRLGNVYLVPFLDKENNVLFSIRIDARTGDVLELGKWPSSVTSTQKQKIDVKQAFAKAQKIFKDNCLKIGKIYKNPRGIYFAEVKCKKGKILAMIKSDGNSVW